MSTDEIRGRRLRDARIAAGLTLLQMATAADVDPHLLGMFERGTRRPKYATWQRMAAVLNLPADAWIVPAQVVGAAS